MLFNNALDYTPYLFAAAIPHELLHGCALGNSTTFTVLSGVVDTQPGHPLLADIIHPVVSRLLLH